MFNNEMMGCFENAENFANWVNNQDAGVRLSDEEAKMILGYVEGHGYAVRLNDQGTMICVDLDEPENEPEAYSIEELIEQVSQWNYEFLQDNEVTGEWRDTILRDAEIIDGMLNRMGTRTGYSIGTPTVKALIEVLRKFPEDYIVTCGGAENYLYLFAKDKYITIDHESYLS